CAQHACDSTTGACVPTFAPAGTLCNDFSQCTVGDSCDGAGVCRPTDPVDCNDGDVCTTDTCSDLAGCFHMPSPDAQGPRCVLEPVSVCRVPGDVEFPHLVYAYFNRSAENIEAPIGEVNRFNDPADRGQPRLFPPGPGAFRTPLRSSGDTWTL